jgi:hypothetical protein
VHCLIVSIGELEYTYQAVAYSTIPDAPENVAGVTTNLTFSLKHFPQSNRFELQVPEPAVSLGHSKESTCSHVEFCFLDQKVFQKSSGRYFIYKTRGLV